jgi:transcriptional regulator with XRE-family HTH domain
MTPQDQKVAEALGAAIRLARKNCDLSQEALADLASIDRTYVSMLERGKRQATVAVICRLAECMGIKASKLVRSVDDIEVCS